MVKSIVFSILLFSFFPTFCQTLTVRKLYDEYRNNKYTFQNKYKNQTLTITGRVRSVSRASDFWKDQDVHRVHLTATGYENFVVCQIPYKDSTILNLFKVGEFVTVTGTTSSNISDAIFLTNCSFTAANPTTKKSSSPDNAPLGKYHVYQTDGKGFNYQYAFDLKSYQAYVLNGEVGKCSYSAQTKSITFSTGPLKGFAGLYQKTTENEADPPSFILNPKGTVPVANSTHQGYQFGYYQGK